MQIGTILDTPFHPFRLPHPHCFILKTTVMDVKGNFTKASSDKIEKPGFKVVKCKYIHAALIKILTNEKYKYLVLQFHALNIDGEVPHFSAIAYARQKTDHYGDKYELEPISGEMEIGKYTSAIMGNTILRLDELRKVLDDNHGGYKEFTHVQFTPRIQDIYSGHIVYDAEAMNALQSISQPLPCNPCPPACPVG
jgi:hypothetical protein